MMKKEKKEAGSVRFLYGTAVGRFLLKGLTRPFVSKVAGAFLSSAPSRLFVSRFIKKNGIDMSAFEGQKYRSFNDFFSRKRSYDGLPSAKDTLASPCDAYLSIYKISEEQSFEIKHSSYRIDQLLQDAELAKQFQNGLCLIFRLTPQHYHRYCYACTGKNVRAQKIRGRLHCVRPIAYTQIPVFSENSRELVCYQTERLGTVVQMEIGALMVGRIENHDNTSDAVQGEEKGYFAFGGSTIVVLLEENKVNLAEVYSAVIGTEEEISVRLGDTIGTAAFRTDSDA